MIKQPRGYRLTSNGRYRAEIYEDGRLINLGSFRNENDAAEAYRIANENRLRRGVMKYGYCLEDGVTYKRNYTAFDDGTIFGPSGNKMIYTEHHSEYLQCNINGVTERVHRIIAECFIPNPFNKPQVNHINGNKKDNRVENLEWATPKENTRHAYDNGLASGKPKYGKANGRTKLNEEKVKFIRSHYNKYDKQYDMAELAKMFDVGITAIYKIIHNKTWIGVE